MQLYSKYIGKHINVDISIPIQKFPFQTNEELYIRMIVVKITNSSYAHQTLHSGAFLNERTKYILN